MSEKLRGTPESGVESLDTSKESERNLERLEEAALEAAQDTSEELHTLEERAKAEAVSGAEVSAGEDETARNDTPSYMHKELKSTAYQRGLERIRSNLSGPDRLFSKVVHNASVETVSEVAGKTVARPSGFFGGALATLVGSAVLTYLTRHYGFSYNYLFFVFLFVGGYCAGLLLEAVIRLFRR